VDPVGQNSITHTHTEKLGRAGLNQWSEHKKIGRAGLKPVVRRRRDVRDITRKRENKMKVGESRTKSVVRRRREVREISG
jgi:hypothetical protein